MRDCGALIVGRVWAGEDGGAGGPAVLGVCRGGDPGVAHHLPAGAPLLSRRGGKGGGGVGHG